MVDLTLLPDVPISVRQRVVLDKLMENSERIVKHSELRALWPNQAGTQGALNMVIYNLRHKLFRHGYDIVSHRGLGYALIDRTSPILTKN